MTETQVSHIADFHPCSPEAQAEPKAKAKPRLWYVQRRVNVIGFDSFPHNAFVSVLGHKRL